MSALTQKYLQKIAAHSSIATLIACDQKEASGDGLYCSMQQEAL